jgi:hypothetical protein
MAEKPEEWWLAPPNRVELHRTRTELVSVLLSLTNGMLAMQAGQQAVAIENLNKGISLLEKMVKEEQTIRGIRDE